MVTPMGLMVTIPALSYTYAPSLKSVATAVVSSTNYAILVGDEALRYRLNLNTGTLTALTTATYPTSGAPVYTDAAINTSGNTVLTSADGKAFYCSNVHTGTTFTQISTTASSLYGASMVPSASTAIVVGNSGIIGTLSSTLFTQQTGIYGPKLNSVHFSSTSMGTVVGDNFFVRATSNSGTNWSRVLPFTVNPTNLIVNVTDVWTRPTNTSAHYALLGGASYLSYCLGNVATPDGTFNALGLTVNDIQFSTYSPNTGYIAAGTSLKKIQLTVSGGTYTTSITSPLSAALPTTINAIHVFTHGSNTSELMLVGNNMIRYKEEGASTTTSLLGGAAGNIRAVVFTDMDHGYVAGDAGLFYETDVITYNTSGSAYTAMSWMQHNVNDAYTGSATNMNITSLEFPTATRGIWGGNYTTSPGSAYAAVRVLNVEDQNYSSRFYYDRLGRIVVSQNSRQKGESKYSYTLYDGLGRVVEAGEKTENTAGGGATFFASIFGTSVGGQYITSVIDDTKLNNWITTQSTTTRKEVTKSYYDLTNASIDGNGLSTYDANFFDKPTQRKRIVHVTYEETYDNSDATYDHATHYNYDIHGNVVKLLQDNKKMGALTSLSTQRFKKMNYVFDLISGNVIRVDYEHGDADQWHHAYVYDADNRITDVYTTTATPLFATSNAPLEVRTEPMSSPYWYKEANYRYYDHGPLMRTELSEEQVQGLDYVYTLQGWIKGVNSNTLDVTRDPGADGATSGSAMRVARDVMGYSLHYYTDDYLPITTGNATFNASQSSSDLVNTSNSKDMFNGNIARMVTTITHPDTRAVLPLGNAYRYDQLNRLTDAVSFTNLNTSANTWGSGGTGIYQNNFTYDANGNILTQVRKNETGATIDDLQYKYQKNSAGKTIRNRLYHVDDNTASGTYSDDIDDMGTFADGATINSANNYAYDAEGRLIKDVQEQIASIVWRVDGKVKEINRTSGSSKKNLKFDYDAMGHRIAKHVLTSANVLEKSTYYILDAQGNTIATYERAIEAGTGTVTFAQKEKFIYGSARLGVLNDDIALYGSQNATYSQATWTHIIGKRNYELSNHLGNVLSVISDKPMPVDDAADGDVDWFLADIRQSTDYSAFGVQLSGRNLYKTGAKKSRFGMNGMEVDDEIKGGGNSYDFGARMLDPRLGRWLTIDPMSSKHPNNSPYLFCNANPILFKDPDGKDFIITIIQEPGRNEIIVSTVAHAYGHLAEQLVENFNIKNPDGVFSRSGSYIDADGINWTITVQIEIVVDHSLDEIGSPIDGGNTTANENWYEDLKTASPNFPKGHVTVNTEYIPPATILEYGAMGNDWTGATYYSSVMHGIFHNLGADDHYSWEGDLSSRIVDQYSYIYDQHFKMLGSALLEYDAKLNKYDRSKAGYRDFVVRPIDVGMYQSKSNTFACSPSIPWSTASWPEIYQEQFNRFLKYNPEGFRLPENTCDGKKENYTEVSHGQEVIFSN
jgi:RHS repeat-associated protein